jgi:hypothetical protein
MDKKVERVKVKSYSDLIKAIKPFVKCTSKRVVKVQGEISWVEEDDKGKSVQKSVVVSADNRDISLRDLLIEGFDQVKEQSHLWSRLYDALLDDEYAPVLPQVDIDSFHMPVDRIIRDRLDGKREGLRVTWLLDGKKYYLDPYEGILEEEQI